MAFSSACPTRAPCRRLGLRRLACGAPKLHLRHVGHQGLYHPHVRPSVSPAARADEGASSSSSCCGEAAPCTSTSATSVGPTAVTEAEGSLQWPAADAAIAPVVAVSDDVSVATPDTDSEPDTEVKSDEYSEDMQKKMGTTLSYRHEDGINYNRILPDLIVGSCLQTAADVDLLAEREGVRTVFCLQEDPDMAYFSLDIEPIQARCEERGDIKHVRFPIRDFDPFDLRRKLPKAVSRLAREHNPDKGTVYIHCTAGLGRAPATALAYMFWLRGYQLDSAFEMLRGKRMCSPRIEAIRSATVDLLVGSDPVLTTIGVSRTGTATDFKIAGLDVGWHQQLPLEREEGTGRMVLRRLLQPGKYTYKFIIDGNWTYSADHPTLQDGNNINNYVEVMGRTVPDHLRLAQQRLLQVGGDLTAEERAELSGLLCPWATHGPDDDNRVEAEAAAAAAGVLPPPQVDWSDKWP